MATTQRAPRQTKPELDRATLTRAQRSEAKACQAFVAFYERPVFSALSRILGPAGRHAVVEDLAQETFLRALRALPRFDDEGPAKLSTWLLTIATRLALTELGQRGRDAVVLELAPERSHPGDATRVDTRQALTRAIEALTPEQRAVFVLRDAHGFTETEVARALELEVGAVKSRLHRARNRLRKALEGQR